MSDGRDRPGWFLAAKSSLGPAIAARNKANKQIFGKNPSFEEKRQLGKARKAVKRAVELAKLSWMETIIQDVNESEHDHRPTNPQRVWDAIRELERGPRKISSIAPMNLRKNQSAGGDAALCDTQEETAAVMATYLADSFSKKGRYDPEAINLVPLRPLQPWLDNPFSEKEISSAVHKMANNKSAGATLCPAEYYKALASDSSAKNFLCEVVNGFWKSGSFPQGDIPLGPPPDISTPTMALAVEHGWKIEYQQINPKQPGSDSWRRYELYKNCTTTAEALECGCTTADLKWDWKRGFFKVFDPQSTTHRIVSELLPDDSQGLRFEEWDVAKLVLLPKKGEVSLGVGFGGGELVHGTGEGKQGDAVAGGGLAGGLIGDGAVDGSGPGGEGADGKQRESGSAHSILHESIQGIRPQFVCSWGWAYPACRSVSISARTAAASFSSRVRCAV